MFDPAYYPHVFQLILDNLSRREMVVLRDVSRSCRTLVDPILFRHLVVGSIDEDKPVFFHTPGSTTVTVPWTTQPSTDRSKDAEAQNEAMSLMRKHCEVMDIVNHGLDFHDVPEQRRNKLQPLRSLPNVRVIRCFASRGFEFPVDTVIDFALDGWGQNWHYCPLPVRCNRYVVAKVRPQHFSRLQLERVRRVTEVIIHCVSNKGQPPLWAINVFRKLPLRVHITLVGLATPSGDTSGDKVQQ